MTGFAVFRSRTMAVLFVLGFASGLPMLLTGQTLRAWLTGAGATEAQIAALSLIGLAYALKFVWAPFLDRFALPGLGRRRGWILVLQIALVAAIAAMAMLDPRDDGVAFTVVAAVVALLSASQDVVIDAYSADVLAPHERAAGSASYVLGYRTAMLATGALALVMADHTTWRIIYLTMAAVMAIAIAGTIVAREPVVDAVPPRTLASAVYMPFVELVRRLGRRGAALVVGFAALYKFGDQFAQVLTLTFLQRDAGFSWTDIAIVYQVLGFVGTAMGGLFGGAIVARVGIGRVLLGFGLIQASTLLLYAWLAFAGKSLPIFCVAVVGDNLAYAMATSAFVGYLMSACSPSVSATQLALLTSLSSVGQRVFGSFASVVVDAVGWPGFFVTCSVLAIPGLVLAARIRKH
jgi:PAT family beta-lactamase induction signal transducer AmpG